MIFFIQILVHNKFEGMFKIWYCNNQFLHIKSYLVNLNLLPGSKWLLWCSQTSGHDSRLFIAQAQFLLLCR